MIKTLQSRLLAFLVLVSVPPLSAQSSLSAARIAELKELSLDQLLNLEVSTVSRREERWWSVPNGVDVVTNEEIRRAGARNLPDALRLATGVHVGQPSARSWAVSVRGMNVLAANKISVAMDGRILFTPFFSGVQWDAQDTLMEDIDRIEVVRGPVGSLWGAFAVNGFIQILTKPAWDTQGWLASAGAGTEDPGFASVRYGGQAGDDTYYRVYAKYFQTNWTYNASGRAQSATDFFQGGFRVDALRARETTLTLQGDYYTNRDLPLDRVQTEISGANILGRWRRAFSADSNVQAKVYFDHTYRLIPAVFEETRDTAASSLKWQTATGRQDLLLGVDGLLSWDEIGNIGIAKLVPPKRTTHNIGVYVQDTVQLVPKRGAFTLGIKGEHNSFSGFEYQPTARFAWTPTPQTTLWSAVSRAVRTPVRIDEDLLFELNGTTIFEANDDFKTEYAWVYELGFRQQPSPMLTFDVSAFAYRYNNIRSTEPIGSAAFPRTFKNEFNAKSSGAEVTVLFEPAAQILVKGSYRFLDLDFSRDAGSRDTTQGSSEGNDAKHVANLSVHFELPGNWEFDTFIRHASSLPKPALAGYTELDVRLGWNPSPEWELSLSGRNLLDRQHPEFVTTNSLNQQVHRSFTLKATWRR